MADANRLFSDFELTMVTLEYTSFARTASLTDNHISVGIEIPGGKADEIMKMILDYLNKEEEDDG